MNDHGPLVFDYLSWCVTTAMGGGLALISATLAFLGRRGYAPRVMRALYALYALLAFYSVSLTWVAVAYVVSLADRRETDLWCGVFLAGLVGTVACVWNRPGRWNAAPLAEQRRMAALDL
jgi:hypothetical protein